MADNDAARRYKRAAEAALQQLDWCIVYLRGARKTDLAKALSRNRDHIRQRLHERGGSEPARKH